MLEEANISNAYMKHIKWPPFCSINLGIVSGVIISFLNLLYPMVGHDYAFVIPQMLDSHLHFLINGLGIQWYTPSFGGGLPAFPNPNNVQFLAAGRTAHCDSSLARNL